MIPWRLDRFICRQAGTISVMLALTKPIKSQLTDHGDSMEIRPAATLALVRDSEKGLEVLLLQRSWEAVFLPGFFVFPGGAVDAQDQQGRERITGTSDAAVSQTMSLDEGGADYMIAAIRECFEESGLLLATDRQGDLVRLDTGDGLPEGARMALDQGEITFPELCERHGLSLPLDRLAYLSHWITPPGPPRRFDTRFFVAAAPAGQTASHDGKETIDHAWLTPSQALEDHRYGRRLLGSPTVRTLRILSDFQSVDSLLAYAHANPPAPSPTEAWPAWKGNQKRMIEPDTPAYDEVRKLDPERQGLARAEIIPGAPVILGPGVQRLTAANAGLMTGPGTNTYLLGNGGGYTVIDPGPDDRDHINKLLEMTGSRIRQVLVTHTHRDHSPGAMRLREMTGATVVGLPAPDGTAQDTSFRPDVIPADGEVIATPAGELTTIYTPGHASNHMCYLLADQHILFSGDHIMQGSTVVINPPDGDMKAYLDSLNRLLRETINFIAPGHGFLMGHAHSVIDFLTTHRLAREHKVYRALKAHQPASSRDLVTSAYDDVPPAIHPLAERSLLAHLVKLEKDNRASRDSEERWSLR